MILDDTLHACYILFSNFTALKLYGSFKVTEKQRQKINEEMEKQRQIEIQRYKNNVLVIIFYFYSSSLFCVKKTVIKLSYVLICCVVRRQRSDHMCDNPGCKNPARLYCVQCQGKTCSGCAGFHLLEKSKKGHNMVEYKDRTQHGDILYCKTHEHAVCELYCEHCEIPVCSKCVSGKSHKGHDFTEISAVFNIKRTCVIKEREGMKSHIQLLKVQKEVMDTKLEESEKKYNNLVTEVEIRKDEMLKAVETAANNQLQKIEDLKNFDHNQIQAQKEELEEQITKANAVLESWERLLKGLNPSELFSFESKASDLKEIPEMIVLKEYNFKKGSLSTEVIESEFGDINKQ